MQKYQRIWKHACGMFQQRHGGRFVVRLSVGVVAALVFLGMTVSIGTQSVQAHVLSTCSAHEQKHRIIAGDTLNGIAHRYSINWSSLASRNDIANPNLIFVGQLVCISSVREAQEVAPVATPSVVNAAPAPAPAPVASGSVTSIINQVFGPYAAAATQVVACESGLNPGATNPYSSAAGLFQIMPATWSGTSQAGSSPYNAWANTVAAHEIFVRDGYSWSEWTCK